MRRGLGADFDADELRQHVTKHLADDEGPFQLEARVDEGPKLKRSHPMSRGRAYPIIKRTSHIMIVLKEIKPTKEVKNAEVKEIKKEKPEAKEVNPPSRKASEGQGKEVKSIKSKIVKK